jgi:hypothetical protein
MAQLHLVLNRRDGGEVLRPMGIATAQLCCQIGGKEKLQVQFQLVLIPASPFTQWPKMATTTNEKMGHRAELSNIPCFSTTSTLHG